MRSWGALGFAGLLLSGCVSGDRVTLLPHADGGPVGSVAVLAEGEGEETVLDQENQQAKLTRRGARVRQLDETDPKYQELIKALPAAPSALSLSNFPTGEFSLSAEQIASIREHLSDLDSRPGYQVEVRGYTDSVGDEDLNLRLSQERAEQVAAIIREQGFEVEPGDVLGMGEFEARRRVGDEMANAAWRKVDVVIR